MIIESEDLSNSPSLIQLDRLMGPSDYLDYLAMRVQCWN